MLNRRLAFILFCCSLTVIQVNAAIIYVPTDQPTIQTGINAAAIGDTVLVEPGTYLENINFRAKGITVASRFLLTGNTDYIGMTVINGSQPVHPDTGSCVLITSPTSSTSLDTSAALIGLTLIGGSGTKWLDEHGAGIYREGGGVLTAYLSPRIRFNKIIQNQAINLSGLPANHAGGGGLRCGDGNPRIENNLIVQNYGLYGGGLVLNFTGAVVRNNLIAYDTSAAAYFGGGGIWINGNSTTGAAQLINNTIVYNQSPAVGSIAGGMAIFAGSPEVRNSIIWGNTGVFEIYSQVGTQPSYSDIEGGYPGTGNIDDNPDFSDPLYFYLADTSDCIDAGDPGAVYFDPENPLNPGWAMWPSQGGLRNDMGVYGGPNSFSFEGMIVGVRPEIPGKQPEQFNLQSYPNPFNSDVTIKYSCPGLTDLSLKIYNLQGQDVKNFSRHLLAGESGAFTWDGTDALGIPVAAGVYLCRLHDGSRLLTSRLVLLK